MLGMKYFSFHLGWIVFYKHRDILIPIQRFGTLSEYFDEVRARSTKFDSLSGDFFVYSDIFTDGIPAYWSGYFTTR